jgi:cytochrome c556
MAMRGRTIGLLLGLAGAATVAVAATPQQTIQARQANFKAIGKATKAIMDETRKPSPDIAVIRPAAAQLVTLSGQLPRWFPRGSGPEAGVKTGARAEIWTKPAEFRTAAVNFNKAARVFNAAAARGDMAAVGAAARGLGATCKGCHDSFRAKDD